MKAARLPVGSLLIAGLAIAFVFTTCASRRAIGDVRTELDSIRSEETRLRADSAGWGTAFAIEVERGESLGSIVAAQDQQLRILGPATDSLIRQVELLEGRVAYLSEMYLGAVGQIETHGVVHASDAGATPDSVTADVDDGLLAAHLYYRPPATLGANPYRVTIPLVATVSELADGRALFAARAADPRVTIELGAVYYQPPAPVQFCGLGTRVKDHGRGYAIGRVLELAITKAFGG